jgi:hypothetical protein
MARQKISEETRRLAKEKAKKAKLASLAENALAYLPKDPDARREIWDAIDQTKEFARQAAASAADARKAVSEMKKRAVQIFKQNPKALQIQEIYQSIETDEEFKQVYAQVESRLRDLNKPIQFNLNLDAMGSLEGQEEEEEGKTIFDQTATGERLDGEGARPRIVTSKSTNGAVEPPQPSPAMPLDEAQDKFEKAAQEKAERDAQRAQDAGAFHEKSNVVQLPQAEQPVKRRGRPPLSDEEKARRAQEKAIKAAADRAEEPVKPETPKAVVKAAADRAEQSSQKQEHAVGYAKPELHPNATDEQRRVFEETWEKSPSTAIQQALVVNKLCEAVAKKPSAPPLAPMIDDDDGLPDLAPEPDQPSGGYVPIG